MPITKKGIYHNLKESKYTISNGEIVFFFSSRLYMEKFLLIYQDNRSKFIDKMDKLIIDNQFNMATLSDITLYKSIEKRGFHVWLKGVNITWQDLNLYALRKMTKSSINEWYEIQKPKLIERLKIME